MSKVSRVLEKALFGSRWLLAPLYVGLAGVLLLVLLRFGVAFWSLLQSVLKNEAHSFTVDLLALLDLVLLANLLVIVIFAGYENFVSRMEVAQNSKDRPHWMGTIDFSGLKLKLIGSLVAISVIELLKDFIHLGEHPEQEVGQGYTWRIAIHLVFVLSGVLFSLSDFIAAKINPTHGISNQV